MESTPDPLHPNPDERRESGTEPHPPAGLPPDPLPAVPQGSWDSAQTGETHPGAETDPGPLPRWSPPTWAPRVPWTPLPIPAWGPLPRHSTRHYVLAGGLFLLTVGATMVTWGPLYAAAIMTILLSHEMGHYVQCRRYRVRSTLPLFVPMPIVSPFGTMGAVILMRQLGRNRRELFDIGIAGPLAGMVPALIATVWGLAHSQAVPLAAAQGGLRLGDSLLFSALQKLIHPGLGPDMELLLHPVAYAGWAGFFVTALNLLPIGQLDGGHVIYGIWGRKAVYASWVVLAGLAVVAVFNPQWWVLVGLLVVMGGPRHRPALDETTPVGTRRILLGVLALALFVLCFTPKPFEIH